MRRPSLIERTAAALVAVAMLTLSAGFGWAVADDLAHSRWVPAGVRIGEVELGGLPAGDAARAIETEVAAPLLKPLGVSTPDGAIDLDASDMLSVDIPRMVESALQPRRDASLPERVAARLTGRPVDHEVEPVLAVDEDVLREWVAQTAARVDRRPIDSTVTVGEGTITVTPHEPGYRTLTDRAVEELTAALLAGDKEIDLAVEVLEPQIRDDSWGKMILVDLSQRRLWLYDGRVLEKTYRVAVGKPGYSTPKGTWTIVNKRYMPGWSNPGSAWAADMPAYIPPGWSNPLGTRALDLNASGIRIHGTTKNYSIGTAASHGCMRMHRWDIEDLYDRVPVGTRVFIVR